MPVSTTCQSQVTGWWARGSLETGHMIERSHDCGGPHDDVPPDRMAQDRSEDEQEARQ